MTEDKDKAENRKPLTDYERWEYKYPGKPFQDRRENSTWWRSLSDTKKAIGAIFLVVILAFSTGGAVATTMNLFQNIPARVASIEERVMVLESLETQRSTTERAKLTILAFLACREEQRVSPSVECPPPPRWWEALQSLQ